MERRNRWSLAVAILLVLAPAAAPAPAQEAPPEPDRPCERDPRHAQLDFWVGAWRVVGPGGQVLGESRVARRHGGCVIEEEWTSARGDASGEGLSFVDPADGRWRHVWVGSSGTVVRYEGELRDGALRFQGRATAADGTVRLARAVLEPLPDGRVRQRIERSDDGGATWQRFFEGTYEPVAAGEAPWPPAPPPGEPRPEPLPEAPPAPEAVPAPPPAPAPAPARVPTPPPAPPPAPEPAPVPPAPGRVVVVSPEAREEAQPARERPKVQLESPMVFEIPVGPVEAIPRGYSWSTAETDRYSAEGVSLRKVTAARVERRGRVDLEVTAALFGARYLQRAALEVALLAGGETIAVEALAGFPLGRSVPAQEREAGLDKRVVLSLDRATFDRIFSAEERPVLRLTVTVGE